MCIRDSVICVRKAKIITSLTAWWREAQEKEGLDSVPWKAEKEPSSLRPVLELYLKATLRKPLRGWMECMQAFLNWMELSIKWISTNHKGMVWNSSILLLCRTDAERHLSEDLSLHTCYLHLPPPSIRLWLCVTASWQLCFCFSLVQFSWCGWKWWFIDLCFELITLRPLLCLWAFSNTK